MDRDKQVLEIYHQPIDKEEKLRLLKDIDLDLRNEMEAQDQNMNPELQNKLAEGLRLVTDFIRELEK